MKCADGDRIVYGARIVKRPTRPDQRVEAKPDLPESVNTLIENPDESSNIEGVVRNQPIAKLKDIHVVLPVIFWKRFSQDQPFRRESIVPLRRS
jgi:hypothetical protein